MELPVLMMMLYIFMFCSKVSLAQSGGDSFSYESQPQEVLQCDVTVTDRSVAWVDATDGSVPLFIYFRNDDQPLDQSTGDKHSNFEYAFVNGSHFNLVINNVERTDVGRYDCIRTLSDGRPEVLQYTLIVEVPGTISIRDENSAIGSSLDVTVDETRQLTCQVIGARSSNNLAITWTPSSGTITENNPTSDGETLMDYNSTIEYEPARDRTTIACSLGQFESQLGKVTKSITLNVRYRPACTLTYSSPGDGCTQVKLTCDCDANPDPDTYEFDQTPGDFNGTISGNTATAYVEKDSDIAFTCRASNLIDETSGFGDRARPKDDYTCSTTEKPDSATKAPTTASSAGLIIGIIAAVVVVICLVAFLVWFFKFRGGEDDPTATNPSRDGVQEPLNKEGSPKSKTKSAPPPDNKDPEIPAYGVVNKPKKTPEPAPRGNTMELQYADLDHGNAPPSNQIRMPEEPTEYATVQSVVV